MILYSSFDDDGYGIYNHKRSACTGEFFWKYNYGNISELYDAFRDRGIVFENDIYADINERNQQILRMIVEKNLFDMGNENK